VKCELPLSGQAAFEGESLTAGRLTFNLAGFVSSKFGERFLNDIVKIMF
jgi:hypothetical protein